MSNLQRTHSNDGHQHFIAINQIVRALVERPESFDAEALQDVAGVLLDLNIYANQLHAELTAAQGEIALLRNHHHAVRGLRPRRRGPGAELD